MKRFLIYGIILITIITSLTGCSIISKEGKGSVNTYVANEKNVKLIGRTYMHEDTLWLAFSGTGVEFSVKGKKAEITISGDNIATNPANENSFARVAIYVDGSRVIDDMINEAEKTYTAFSSDKEEEHTVRVVKLSESANSTIGIKGIKVDSKDGIKPTEEKKYKIEIIGDSITCGYGVDDVKENGFKTSTEDVTKAYAYKTAMALDVDYSIVSASGNGIITGYTTNGQKQTWGILPKFYDKVGNSGGSFAGTISPNTVKWDFSKYTPDLVVINLGTNDASYCGNDADKQAEYVEGYVTFLKQIREKNPNAKILCTLGIMGTTLCESVENAVDTYTAETGDKNVASMRFDEQNSADGYGADWHPTEATHNKAADKLVAEIKSIMGW